MRALRILLPTLLPLLLLAGCFPREAAITSQLQVIPDRAGGSDSVVTLMSMGSDTMDLGRGRIREENLRYRVGADSVVMRLWYPVGVPVDTSRLIVLVAPYNTQTLFLFPLALATTRRGFPTAMLSLRGTDADVNKHLEQSYGVRESDDLTAGLDAYQRRHNLPNLRVGIFGASLGSAVAIETAQRDARVAALSLEGLLDSIETAGRRLFSEEEYAQLSTRLADQRERLIALSPRVSLQTLRPLPLMVRWGSRENLVTEQERRELTALIQRRFPVNDVRTVEGGSHVMRYGFPLSQQEAREVNEEIVRFLEQHIGR